MKQYLEVGKIINTHGIRGEMKLLLWCDGIDALEKVKTVYLDADGIVGVKLLSCRSHKGEALVTLEGVSCVEDAQELKNRVIYVDRNDITMEEDRYFIQDIIGCAVKNVDNGEHIGIIDNVENFGASDIYSVKNQKGQMYLIPVIDEVIKQVDTENKEIKIKVMKGLLDNED